MPGRSGLNKVHVIIQYLSMVRGSADLVWPAPSVPQLDVLLVLDAVQVLVEPVQQEGQKLLAVMLLVAQELRRKVAHFGLHTHTRT